MFRFTIRDVLWLTVVVALGLMWFRAWSGWQDERRSLMLQRDKDVENERRLGVLRAREAAEIAAAGYKPVTRGVKPRSTNGIRMEEPMIELPLGWEASKAKSKELGAPRPQPIPD